MEAFKCGSDHRFVKEYFRIVNERIAKVGKKKEWLKQFGEAKTDFDRVCYLLRSLEASNEDKKGIGVLGLPTKRDEVVKFNVKSDEFADKILLSLKTRKGVSESLDYVNRALFFAESDATKIKVLAIRSRLLSRLGELKCFRAEPPEVTSKDSSKYEKMSHEKKEEVSCCLSASPSGLLQLKNTGNKRGWTLEVTQDVSVGDVLMVDKPYASNLLSDHFGTHCYHCYKRTLSFIPCHSCPYVGFCSETCAESASKHKLPASAKGTGRHVYDCHGILACIMLDNYAGWPKESKDSVGGPIVARLAFACVANTDPDTLLDNICSSGRYAEEGRGHQAFEGAAKIRERPPSVLDPTDYSAAAWLVACSEQRNRADLWQRTVAAVFLTYCLSLGGYPMDWFDESPDFYTAPSLTKRPKRLPASWVASCILYHLQSVSANAHSYSEEVFVSLNNLAAVKPQHIVSCLYPTLSLVNHSCDPTTFRVCTGGGASCFLAALRPLPAGSEILDCYTDCFSLASKEIRQKELTSHYLFQCACKACTGDWPGFLDVRMVAMRALKCPQCKGVITLPARRCLHCKSPKALVLYERLTNVALPKQFELVERGVVNEGSVKAAKKLLEDMNALIERPNWLYDRAQEMFKMTVDFTQGIWVLEPWA